MKAIFVIDNSKTNRKKNTQFYECKRENRPLVVITPHGKHASVEVDMFPTDRNLDNSTADAICKVLIQYSESSAQVWRSLIRCHVERVKKSLAESLATHIYNIANDAMPRLKHCGGLNMPLVR